MTNKKSVPTFEGRLYTGEELHGLAGNWVRRAEVDALLDEVEQLRGEAEVAGEQLAQLRGFAEAHKTCRGSDEPLEQRPGTILKAFDVIRETMRDDPEYAWSWHCNIAMPIMDTAKVSHELANKAAAHLMQHLFAIDTRDNQHYQYRSALKSEGASRDASSGACTCRGCPVHGIPKHMPAQKSEGGQ